jgi:hypothetical protein
VLALGAGGALPVGATGTTTLRHCGKAPHLIGSDVRASRSISCRRARAMITELLGASKACHPNGYTPRPICRLYGFRCSAYVLTSLNLHTSVGRCVKGKLQVKGIAFS